ncbi:IucA/IucC family protein [Paenibacillus mucilaginosus]|uniref:Petrobactin biosynthesis protein AsbA n=1 Tax=Paenibacillus mucilaginosus (strain KNP414) TaxID=1036673 RepID=F8FKH7_PAEMK|nr:IucA/IucC family protein [Paenibacillus mucilaginosus]AEI45570.1 Petrobactin biosynthesis protein AsbA [Paenibacillus mucilaginosus KNP414]MCG7215319.1 IucA/IucC family siderophore biosynthesis protein [Paenibacillus mucilaginosus]WDM26982.1 IucA/IucC family siderophore biosynthesis protein [Paenibacillus mucilaginosus]
MNEAYKADIQTTADHMALQSLLNCYLRETESGVWETAEAIALRTEGAEEMASPTGLYLSIPLSRQGITLRCGVRYTSPTGRHLFQFPVYYRTGTEAQWIQGDYLTVTVLLIKELGLTQGKVSEPDELVLRVIQSTRLIQEFVEGRKDDAEALYGTDFTFLDAEQSLLFGHLIHPTPKSRQGVPDGEQARYSPELQGSFPLHYFRAHRSIVAQDSVLESSAEELLLEELRSDPLVDGTWLEEQIAGGEHVLIPVHPLQAQELLRRPGVRSWIAAGLLKDLGEIGSEYYATSSLRTVYRPDSRFMLKFSIPVKVTNSLRVNLFKELERGVEVQRLMGTSVGRVREEYPPFDIVGDPAYLTLRMEGQEESGFELVLRDNPFRGEAAQGATLVAGLVQDPLPGKTSRLSNVIRELAAKEGRTTEEVSRDWFRLYLGMSLKPMVWLYMTHGIALEAHQQNSVVVLQGGYPHKFYYRDNQGYYFCSSTKELLERELPGIGAKSQTVCSDEVADERFRYYLIFNHMFGLINGFGTAGLADERVLLAELREALASFVPMNREPSVFLHTLLHNEKLPCKANLLTRLFDMDELVGSLDTQSVYVEIDNPLVKEVGELDRQGTAEQQLVHG